MLQMLFKSTKPETYLALDFGNEAIKSLIFHKENHKTSISGHLLRYFENLETFDISKFGEEITKRTIFKIIEEIKEQNKKAIKGIFLELPIDILKGRITLEIYRRDKEKEKITEKEEKDIFQTILIEAEKKTSQIYAAEAGILPEDLSFLTLKIFEIKIDGYGVSKLAGFNGKMLEFKVLTTFLPKYHLESIKKIFEGLDLKILKIVHSGEILQNAFGAEKLDGVFLDIGGEITQIILFKQGKLERIDEMNIGGAVFSRAISQILGLSNEEARILKERYSRGELSEGVREKVRKIISKDLQDWFENLKIKLSEIKTLLPPKILLFGGGSQLLGIEDILTDGDWNSPPVTVQYASLEPYFSFISAPQVKFILPNNFKNIKNIPEKLNNPQFTPVFLLTYE